MDQIAGEEIFFGDKIPAPEVSATAQLGTNTLTPLRLPTIRGELLEWFRRNAVPLAQAYEGSLQLLSQRAFPGRVHFISHAIRDICNRLIVVLDPQAPSPHVQYANEMDKISEGWPNFSPFNAERDLPSAAESCAIPYSVATLIDRLVQAHKVRKQRPSAATLLLHYLMRMQPSQSYLNERLIKDFNRTRKWFEKWAHFRDATLPDADEAELQRHFSIFEGLLHSFVGSFFTTAKELDDILFKANQRAD